MSDRIQQGSLAIDKQLYEFIQNEVMPVVGLDNDKFWQDFEAIVKEFSPRNKALLQKREEFQAKIDEWHVANPASNGQYDKAAYTAFLKTSVISYQRAMTFWSKPKTLIMRLQRLQVRSWSYQFVTLVMR